MTATSTAVLERRAKAHARATATGLARRHACRHLRFAGYEDEVRQTLVAAASTVSAPSTATVWIVLAVVAAVIGLANLEGGGILAAPVVVLLLIGASKAAEADWGDTKALRESVVAAGLEAAATEDQRLRGEANWPGAKAVAPVATVWTFAQVEQLAARVMRQFGAGDAVVTKLTRDGGIDVESGVAVAQVKHWAAAVPATEVVTFASVAGKAGRLPLFFATGGYSARAVEVADQLGVALFVLRTTRMRVQAVSELAVTGLRGPALSSAMSRMVAAKSTFLNEE